MQQNIQIASSHAAITKNEVLKNVALVYNNWIYAWQQYNLQTELDSSYREFANYANKKFELGESGILEKTNAKSRLSEVQLKKSQAEREIQIFENELGQLIGSKDKLIHPEVYSPFPEPGIVDNQVLENNPIIQYSIQQEIMENFVLQTEKAKGLPTINLGIATQSIDRLSAFYSFNIGANIPLFKTGIKARTNAAELGIRIAEKETEKVKLEFFTTYFRLLEQHKQFASQLAYYRNEGLNYAEVLLNTAIKSYKAGNISYVEYIQNINDAVNIKSAYLQTLNEYNQGIIQINYFLNK